MLKRNWNWRNNTLFCHIFVIGEISIGGGGKRAPCSPTLGYAYAPSEENKKDVRKFSARFLAFSNKISTVQKIVLSSSQGQDIFDNLRLRGQGQDFKMCPRGCPRGQGRPRGLHLCVLALEHSCPWPRECLSSKRLFLALASDVFCVLGIGFGFEPCVLDSIYGFGTYSIKGSRLIIITVSLWE